MTHMQRSLVDVIKEFPLRHFERGQTILQGGQVADTLYAIRTGFASVESISSNGSTQMIWVASRYDVIPTESLFRTRGELHFFYTALTDIEVYQIPKQKFLDMYQESPKLAREVAESMSAHYDDLLIRLRAVEQPQIRDKLVHMLQYMASRLSSEAEVNFDEQGLHLTHQDIGKMIGATRETTALELKRLKDDGYIDYSRTSFSVNTTKLAELI